METVLLPILAVLGGLLTVVGTIYLVTAFVVAVQIYSFSISRLVRIPKLIVSTKRRLIFSETDLWAEENGFHYVGLFRIQVVLLAVWENPEKSTFLAQYLNFEGPFFEIETAFDKNISLTTGNVRDGMLMPFPRGNYTQSFPKKSLEELWERHLEAERYLTETGGAHLTPYCSELPWGNVHPEDPFEKPGPSAVEISLTSGVRTQAKHVRSLLLWPLRWPYWYFVRRFTWVHKTIKEQVEMGRLALPLELPPDYEEKIVRWPPKKDWHGFEPQQTASLFNAKPDDEYYIEPEYTRNGVPEPQTVGKIGKAFSWGRGLFFLFIFCLAPLYFVITNQLAQRAMIQVQRSLAEQDYEKAKQRATSIRHRFIRPGAILLVAETLADAGRYDDALELVPLLERGWERENVLQFIVTAKAVDGRFDELDDILQQMDRNYHYTDALKNIAGAQAKAGLFEDAAKTLAKAGDQNTKENLSIGYAKILFELGRFDEAVNLLNSIAKYPEMKIYALGEVASKLATNGNIGQAVQLLQLAVEEVEKIEIPRRRPEYLRNLLPRLRQAGHAEEGLKFVQEIARRFPREENLPVGETALDDDVLAETAILHAELKDYDKAWDVAFSIPTSLDPNWTNWKPKDRAFQEIIKIERKRNLDQRLETDGERIDPLIEELLANAVDEEHQLDPLLKLLVFQIDAGRFAAAEATVQRRTALKNKNQRFAVNLNDFRTRLATGLAEAGRIDDAVKTLKNIRDDESLHAWRTVIKAEAKASRFDDAVKHLPHCKGIPYYRDEAVAEIATAQLEQGRLAEVEKTLDLFKENSRKVGVAVSLAEAYLAAGNQAETVKWTDRLIPLMNRYWEVSSWSDPKPELFSRIAILEAKTGRLPEARETAQRISLRSDGLRAKTLATIGEEKKPE